MDLDLLKELSRNTVKRYVAKTVRSGQSDRRGIGLTAAYDRLETKIKGADNRKPKRFRYVSKGRYTPRVS